MYESWEGKTAWTPDLVGPIYKTHSITLREALNDHRNDMHSRLMATFVPDELIYETDLSKKNFRKFDAVMMLINVNRLFRLHRKHSSANNGGSYGLFQLLNNYICSMIEHIYIIQGDVIKLSQDGMLVAWKVNKGDFVSKIVYNVIICAQKIQEIITGVKNSIFIPKVDIAISVGEVTFSVVGNDSTRYFVMGGPAIDDLKVARKVCLPGDLVLSSSAWDYCAPREYEYVIKDSNNVKVRFHDRKLLLNEYQENMIRKEIIKVLGPPKEILISSKRLSQPTKQERQQTNTSDVVSMSTLFSDLSMDSDLEGSHVQARVSIIDAYRRRIGAILNTYMVRPVVRQIMTETPLEFLTEVRKITSVSVNIIPIKGSVYELISLADKVYQLIEKIHIEYPGCVVSINLYDRDILFNLIYGLKDYIEKEEDEEEEESNARNAVLSASQIMKDTKCLPCVKAVAIGISTGIAFCGVVGHFVRRQFMVFGIPIDKAISMMQISYNKISCDYNTYLESFMKKNKFRSRGIKSLSRFGKCFIYEYIISGDAELISNLEYRYPILGQFQELEHFKDILDEIGVPGRSYSGMVIEGSERSGKSRLLDAYVTIVRNRQIKLVQLCLQPSYIEKSYSVLYHVFIQLFDAEDCTAIYAREKVVANYLLDILEPHEFCYLNVILRVNFPLSKNYCEDTDWKRHTKTIEIFEHILDKITGRVCIFLDNVQFMDLLSWQFFSVALSNNNVVLVMTMVEPESWDNLSEVEAGICHDKRLMNRTLTGLDSKFVAAFACQYLNVIAIPKSLEKVLQRHNKISLEWCEAFLMSTIQVEALNFVTITPAEVGLYDLVFPDSSLLAKIPSYLTPEELAPPLHWSQMSSLNVAIPSTSPTGVILSNRDVRGLRTDMFDRMNSYEKDFIKCAAAIGNVFLRSTVENTMTNSAPLYSKKGRYNDSVAEMIRLRILQCGMIQRKYFHADDSVYYLFHKRKTFSNMHHLITCDCLPSIFVEKTLPQYAYCKMLEFTIYSFRNLLYDIMTSLEKEACHMKIVPIFERESRKCSTCGGGSFLTSFRTEEHKSHNETYSSTSLSVLKRKTSSSRVYKPADNSRKSVFVTDSIDIEKKRENINIRKISILPVHLDYEDEDSGVSSDTGRNGTILEYSKKNKRAQSFHIPTITEDDEWDNRLKEFSYVNYRNCRCNEAINYIFWKLRLHVERCRDFYKLIKHIIQYAAGLILTAQHLFASKFLASVILNFDTLRVNHLISEDTDYTSNKGLIMVLMGDAYVLYGNYSQAGKFYTEALSLQIKPLNSGKAICYRFIMENLKHKLKGFPDYNLNRISGIRANQNLEVSMYLHRLATVYALQNQAKIAKLTALQSLRAAFECTHSFRDKAKVYLTALKIFRQFNNLEFIKPLEKLIMLAINEKNQWKHPESILIVAEVFETMYTTRILLGKLEEGVKLGIRVIRICNALYITELKLSVLPSLISILIWTKRLNEAVDLLHELYYLSKDDKDYSGITWYYALALECVLDAAMVVESYDNCYNYYMSLLKFKTKSFISRDPQSFLRLTTCLAIWQLRMNMVVNEILVSDIEEYTNNLTSNNFAQIYNCNKGLECFLLILKRRINIKKSNDLFDQVHNTRRIISAIEEVADQARFVRPFMYMMKAYMELLRGRRGSCYNYLHKCHKWSSYQGNKLLLAWTEQNKRTWKEAIYNNMAQYWMEHMGAEDAIPWQEIHSFGLNAWSTILYPLPVPDSNF